MIDQSKAQLDVQDSDVILKTCRAYRGICRKYPFTADERVTLEHFWALVEDSWLDAELQEAERVEAETA